MPARVLPSAVALLVLTLGVLPANGADAARPNLVFIMADDHTSQVWGCYGGPLAEHARTANIDRIAREGALLRNCFCTNSICVPSRGAILTGQYSHLNGIKTLRDSLDPAADNVAKHLQQAGYQTALVGKWHLKEAPSGFDYWNIIQGQGRYNDPVMFEGDLDRQVVEKGFSTDVFTDKALAWLKHRNQDHPFCLMLHFKAMHEPWQFPERHAGLYQDVTLPEPPTLLGPTGPENSVMPGWPLELLTERMTTRRDHGDGKLVLDTDDPLERRRATYQKLAKDVLRCVAAIDDNVGRVLETLDREGLADDTVVIYTSDQGYFLGEHNFFDKRFMYEESLRMPFVVRYPREIAAGTVLDDMVLNVDFASTLLDYAGASEPQLGQGRSFRQNLAGQTPDDWRTEMYYRYWEDSAPRPSHFGIRTHRDKLIYFDGQEKLPPDERWEYYDLAADPLERRNKYSDPAHAERIAALKQHLTRLQQELGDAP